MVTSDMEADTRAAIFFPNRFALYLSEATWIENKIISVFDLNSDEINRSVHYVHHILEQKKKSWK